MTETPTSYDTVAYPTMIFRQSRPDALAVIARLHGIAAPAIDTARTLHIGGGDGLDAIALAAAFPNAEFVNFDIAAQPIARGREWSAAAGLTNVRHEMLDILDAAEQLEGPFDYIVAHGIYAWVPDFVRAAVMPLIQRLLAPNGIAFVSYNAMPGGYSRLALRDMINHHVRHLDQASERLASARVLMSGFVTPQAGDQPITSAMRREAAAALSQSDGFLFHDLINENYAPYSLLEVTADAERHGLRFLGEGRGGGFDRGFLDPARADISEVALLNRLQAMDYANGRYFRASLFVRAETPFTRVADANAVRTMWASSWASTEGGDQFRSGERTVTISDPARADMLRRLMALRPDSIEVGKLTDSPDLLEALCHYGLEGFVRLSTVPTPYVLTPSAWPIASGLARMQAARGQGQRQIATLDHQWVEMGDSLSRLIQFLDGTQDRAALEARWSEQPESAKVSLDKVLQWMADNALLKA